MDLNKAKGILRSYFIEYYRKKGLKPAHERLIYFLKQTQQDAREIGVAKDAGQIRGELCEILLELHLKEFVKNNPNSFVVKGLCFTKENDDGYTEMDLTLFTPAQIIFFECKSYSGVKTLTDECTIERDDFKPMNVYAQSKMHIMNFLPKVKKASKIPPNKNKFKHKPLKIVYFGLSLDATIDKRTDEMKQKVPFTFDKNIDKYLTSLDVFSEDQWDILKLYNIVSELNKTSDTNFKKHVKNMQEKHGG